MLSRFQHAASRWMTHLVRCGYRIFVSLIGTTYGSCAHLWSLALSCSTAAKSNGSCCKWLGGLVPSIVRRLCAQAATPSVSRTDIIELLVWKWIAAPAFPFTHAHRYPVQQCVRELPEARRDSQRRKPCKLEGEQVMIARK